VIIFNFKTMENFTMIASWKGGVAYGVVAVSILSSLFFMWVCWRAMKAHEKLAKQVERAIDSWEISEVRNLKEEARSQSRHYKKFVRSHPEVENLTSKERHDRFREWNSKWVD